MKKVVPNDAVLIPDTAKRVFEGQIFDVYQWPQKVYDGSIKTFEMLRRPDTVIVMPVVDDTILVIDDEQPHSGSRLGFPGGRNDQDEEPLEAAKREVKEETGYEFTSWKLLNVEQIHPKIEYFIYFFIALNGTKISEQKLDSGEKITVRQVPLEELKKLSFDKAGYLGQVKDFLEPINSIQELSNLPEFSGQVIDR